MVTRRSLALMFVVAALPACGALIGVKSLVEPDDEDGGPGQNDAQALDGASDAPTTFPDGAPLDGSDGAACGDVTASKDNCGRCGHSCLGGDCKASACQPIALTTGEGEVYGVANDATHVYFTSFTGNFVARVAKTGGLSQKLATTRTFLARKVAVNATHVYWSADDSPGVVARCPLTGCVAAPEVLATPDRPFGLALDSTSVYWADRNSATLSRRPIGGGAEVAVATSLGGLPIAAAVDNGSLFWIVDFTGSVQGAASDGGTFRVGVNGTSGRDLVLNKTDVYWGAAIDPGLDGKISHAPRDGAGPVTFLANAGGEPMALAIDAQRVYWTAWDRKADGGVVSAAVYSCPLASCGARTVVAAAQDLPRGIAVDATAIYWGVNGAVMKLAKP